MTEYEPNRLAINYLEDTYEKLLPKSKYKINSNKKRDRDLEFQFLLNQSQREIK